MQVLQQPSLRRNHALVATITLSFLLLLCSAGLTFHVSRQGVKADALFVHTMEVQRALIEQRLAGIDVALLEQRLLDERQRAAADLRDRFISAVVVMLIASGLLSLFALISVRRYLATVHQSRVQLEELAKAAEEANRERARAESLLTDVNHRVGNNLALVSSFLTMQQRAVKNPDAARALSAARMRVQAIASTHRKLRLGADFATVKVNEVLGAVLEDISAGLPPGDLIRIQCQVEPLEINARDAVSLGVLTSELVMNAVKHAFAPGERGEVSVLLAYGADSGAVLEVSDDGVGWDDNKDSQETGGLGAKIIDMVARQFGGHPERSTRFHEGAPAQTRPGTRIRVNLANLQIINGWSRAG